MREPSTRWVRTQPRAWRACRRVRLLACAAVGAFLLGAASPSPAPQDGTVLKCELTGTVDAGSGAHLSSCVEAAEQGGHRALLVRIDTPGGSLEATQQVVQRFLGASVPILVWVGPSGARAGSAGTFLVLASHFAGMADGTRVGAAHPVGLTGRDIGEDSKHLASKVENDAAAFAASIARARGRNAAWAERAVRESVSIPADDAVKLDVVDVVVPDENELLAAADGKTVSVGNRAVVLETRAVQVVLMQPSLRDRLLHSIADPSLAYLLLLIGGLGIAIELASPGMILPGVGGAVCLLLAMMALAALPVRTGAVVLLLLGVALIAAELFVSSGLLGAGGVVLLILGGLFLVEHVNPSWFTDRSLAVPARLIVPSAVLAGAASMFVLARVAQARRLPPRLGAEALVGELGHTVSAVDERGGEVFVHGEHWHAVSDHPVRPNQRVVVRGLKGLTLRIQEVSS